jgi:hypothetical protein
MFYQSGRKACFLRIGLMMVEEFNSEAASKKFLNVLPIRQEGLLSKKGQFYGMVPLSLSLVERSDMGL